MNETETNESKDLINDEDSRRAENKAEPACCVLVDACGCYVGPCCCTPSHGSIEYACCC